MSSFTSLIHCFVDVTKLSSRFTLANLIVIGSILRILNISILIPLESWDCHSHRNDIRLTAFFTPLFFAFDKFSISFCKCFVIWYKSDYCCLTHLFILSISKILKWVVFFSLPLLVGFAFIGVTPITFAFVYGC